MRYRDAGVDVERSDAIKQRIAQAVRGTWGTTVRPLERGFAGVMEWPAGSRLLAASMDGVGTKLHLALADGRAGDAAADLVYHCANDLLVHGARPLAFLDYIAQSTPRSPLSTTPISKQVSPARDKSRANAAVSAGAVTTTIPIPRLKALRASSSGIPPAVMSQW